MIDTDIEGPVKIQIYNQNGSMINSLIKHTSRQNTVNLGALPMGFYIIKITTEKGQFFTKKLIIE